MATFIVDGQEHELRIIGKNGIDFSADFIGNTSHGMKTDEDGNYIATQEDLDWWQTTMAAHQTMNDKLDEYRQRYGWEAVEQATKGCYDTDLEYQAACVMDALKTFDA